MKTYQVYRKVIEVLVVEAKNKEEAHKKTNDIEPHDIESEQILKTRTIIIED